MGNNRWIHRITRLNPRLRTCWTARALQCRAQMDAGEPRLLQWGGPTIDILMEGECHLSSALWVTHQRRHLARSTKIASRRTRPCARERLIRAVMIPVEGTARHRRRRASTTSNDDKRTPAVARAVGCALCLHLPRRLIDTSQRSRREAARADEQRDAPRDIRVSLLSLLHTALL